MKKTLLVVLLGLSILTVGGCGKQETKDIATTEIIEEVEDTLTQPATEEQEEVAEEVVEEVEETLGVPAGQVPDYAKNWTEVDYGTFKDDTAVVEPVAGEWSSGVFTIDGEVYSVGEPLSKFEDNGWVIAYPEDELYVGEDTASAWFTKGDTELSVYGDITTAGDYKTATLTTFETYNGDIAIGTEVCGLVIGDDFGKYMDSLGTPCKTMISDKAQQYDYKSSDSKFLLSVYVKNYNIETVRLYLKDDNED